MMNKSLTTLLSLFIIACQAPVGESETPLFTDVTGSSGIEFLNMLTFTEELNPYTYRNFYNGAGVALGDINNDGLLDIYFSGNQVENKLFLNLGDFTFRDITKSAGVACPGVWSTGVTFVDINADGWLDIYVCKSGNPDAPNRQNELFINNGDLTFTEQASEYGLDFIGLSVQAAFFDYDKDGDLDCYLLTNSIKSIGNFDLVRDQRLIPDPLNGGNKFLLNDNGKFRDYTAEAGVFRSNIGFGLGITLGDFNGDSWIDIFISNDFFERDYLYINNQKGGFEESLVEYFDSISMGSMGADLADLDNDGSFELFVTEMLPESLKRKKTKTVFDSWDKYKLSVESGYHHQFSRNTLQKRIGHNKFIEIGRYAGVAATEWSWGALLFDMDNDGLRDIFIANGIYKDLLDRDYLAYTGAEDNVRKLIREEKNAILKLIDLLPSSTYANCAYKNLGDLRFENLADKWGLSQPMFSTGSAYGDLDNDGDLDLVVNNVNGASVVYRNNTDTSLFKSISIGLYTESNNTFATGSIVKVYKDDLSWVGDNFVSRGFQSSVQQNIHIGLGKEIEYIDSIQINWFDRGYTMLYNVPVNQFLRVKREDEKVYYDQVTGILDNDKNLKLLKVPSISFKHNGSGMVDFNRDRLLPFMYSNETPKLSVVDIDQDGFNEVYIGGGKNQAGAFLTFRDKVSMHSAELITSSKMAEETKGLFLDVDNDGDMDFYMATGGRSFSKSSSALMDQLFINDGNGKFIQSDSNLPFNEPFSTSAVVSIDFDRDGDLDLVVGERFHPFNYGIGGRAYLLRNDGKGYFMDVTEQYAPMLKTLGMVTDIAVADVNKDGWDDLVLVGDWMPITFLSNSKGYFKDSSKQFGLENTEGWWTTISTADVNNDGIPDFVIGNHGLNSFFKEGDRMYVHDFDGNGMLEQIFCTSVSGKFYPVLEKDELLSQLPSLKKKLIYYEAYSNMSIEDIFSANVLSGAKMYSVNKLSSVILISNGTGYTIKNLPTEAQYSPLYAFHFVDADGDGVLDLLAGGNQYSVKPQFGRYDGSNGWFFKGFFDGKEFSLEKGLALNIKGEIRDIKVIENKYGKFILFAKYDDVLEVFKILY